MPDEIVVTRDGGGDGLRPAQRAKARVRVGVLPAPGSLVVCLIECRVGCRVLEAHPAHPAHRAKARAASCACGCLPAAMKLVTWKTLPSDRRLGRARSGSRWLVAALGSESEIFGPSTPRLVAAEAAGTSVREEMANEEALGAAPRSECSKHEEASSPWSRPGGQRHSEACFRGLC